MIDKRTKRILAALLLMLPALTMSSTAAFAKAGLSELDGASATVLFTLVLAGAMAIPFSVHGLWFFPWYFVGLQIPLIGGGLYGVWKLLNRKEARLLTYFIALPVVYAVLTLTTNMTAVAFFRADHSGYFAMEKTLVAVCDRQGGERPSEAEIRQKLGEPYEADSFRVSSPALPQAVADTMREAKIDEAYILSYFEKCRGRKGTEQRTYYLVLDPNTRRYLTRVILMEPTQWLNKWPYRRD